MDILTESPVFQSVDDRPHNINATVGDTIKLSCKVAAEPKASIIWLRNGVPLESMFKCIFYIIVLQAAVIKYKIIKVSNFNLTPIFSTSIV